MRSRLNVLIPSTSSNRNYNQLNETKRYGCVKAEVPDNFVPATVAYNKKVLRFSSYFKQTVYESS